MKKKILVVIIAVICIFILCSCKESINKDIEESNNANSTMAMDEEKPDEDVVEIEKNSYAVENEEIYEKQEGEENEEYADEFKLLEQESVGFLKLGISHKDVLEELGEAEEKSDAIVWGADGLEHQTWYYQTKGIELDMINDEGNKIVNSIKIYTPCDYRTERNIAIGSTKDEVNNAYKNEVNAEYSTSTDVVAGSIYGGLIFKLENNRVISVFIGAGAE